MDFQLFNNNCVVVGRCGRAGRNGVEWEEFRQYSLFVQKDRLGRNCVIAIKGRDDFAEFDPRYAADDNVLIAEDYYFEVLSLVAG